MQNFRSQTLNLRRLHDDRLSRHFKRLSNSKRLLNRYLVPLWADGRIPASPASTGWPSLLRGRFSACDDASVGALSLAEAVKPLPGIPWSIATSLLPRATSSTI